MAFGCLRRARWLPCPMTMLQSQCSQPVSQRYGWAPAIKTCDISRGARKPIERLVPPQLFGARQACHRCQVSHLRSKRAMIIGIWLRFRICKVLPSILPFHLSQISSD